MPQIVPVAVIQATPVFFDREATTAKAVELIHASAGRGAALILLPEAFIPAYPRGFSFGTVVGSRSASGRELWRMYWDAAVDVPGPATQAIGDACRERGVHAAVGVVERTADAGGTLYCALVYFGPDGRVLAVHRKLKPTASERLIWGEGDGSSLRVHATPVGRIGGLICWENYMPAARMALYAQGLQIYLAPTADARDTWQATLRHIACEGRCFVLAANQFVPAGAYPAELLAHAAENEPRHEYCRGGSAIVSPLGEVIAGPLFDQEGELRADLDLDDVTRARLDFDVAGHYARPDIFQLTVNTAPKPPVRFA